MTEIHDTTNSTDADAETVMPGQSRDSHPLSISHAPLSGMRSATLKNVEGAAHHLPVELPRVVIVGAGFGGLRAARAFTQCTCTGYGDRSPESSPVSAIVILGRYCWFIASGYLFSNSGYSAKSKKCRSIHG